MYALLEALSATVDIERNDIKACLQKIHSKKNLIYAIVLYDAVAGGAGHVRRIATSDGAVFRRNNTNIILPFRSPDEQHEGRALVACCGIGSYS